MRKISILYSWSEVPDGLKTALWQDTVNLFHIQPDNSKKDVFLSAVAERFRDFKSKLVSGWISLKRDRSYKAKRMKKGNENLCEEREENEHEEENEQGKKNEEEGNEKEKENQKKKQAPRLMPYDIWGHITKDEWEAFVAKKTTPKEVEKRGKASKNSSQKKFYHHMGTKTYDESRKEWIDTGFYRISNSSSSAATSSSVTMIKGDRMGWKQKEARGEFTPKANKDALLMVLGKEHKGRVIGKGGIRLGMKKAFGEEYAATRSNATRVPPQDMEAMKNTIEAELTQKMNKKLVAMLEHMGLPIPNLDLLDDAPEDKFSERDRSTANNEIVKKTHDLHIPEPPPDLEEETPCQLLLPQLGVNVGGELIVVAYGRAQPPLEGQNVHMVAVAGDHFSVCIDTIESGFEDISLPVPRPEWSLDKLMDGHASFVAWPRAWVQFSNEVLQKLKKKKNKKDETNKEGSQRQKAERNVGFQEKDKEVQSEATSPARNTKIQRLSSKGSTPQKNIKGVPLVSTQVLESLSTDCFWLHTCISNLPDEIPIQVGLRKNQFHYIEDTFTWVFKGDVREFFAGEMLNVSILQVFMSALYDDLHGCEAVSKVGWLCPHEIRGS